jgi:flagellar protein FlaG
MVGGMTIDPLHTTTLPGALETRRASRAAIEEPRRPRAAALPDAVRTAQGEKVAAAEAESARREAARAVAPEFSRQELAIRKDPEIDRVVVQVLDSATGEVVRQIPSEEWVRHLKRLRGAKGLFVDRKG